jgi:hypothetical protein
MHMIRKAEFRDGFYQNPNVYGEICSRPCPVQLADWGRCRIGSANYDAKTAIADATVTNATHDPQTITLTTLRNVASMTLNGQAIAPTVRTNRWGMRLIELSCPPGTHQLRLQCEPTPSTDPSTR